jgi:hypothetical protein
MNRIAITLKLFPRWNILGLALLSLLVTWLLAYQRMLEYMTEQGTNIEAIGRHNILWSMLDGTALLFSMLVLIAAGIIPFIAVLVKPTPKSSKCAQVIWAVLIVGLLYVSEAAS